MKGDSFIYLAQCSGSNPQAAVTARFAMSRDVRIPKGSTCSLRVGDWAGDFRRFIPWCRGSVTAGLWKAEHCDTEGVIRESKGPSKGGLPVTHVFQVSPPFKDATRKRPHVLSAVAFTAVLSRVAAA